KPQLAADVPALDRASETGANAASTGSVANSPSLQRAGVHGLATDAPLTGLVTETNAPAAPAPLAFSPEQKPVTPASKPAAPAVPLDAAVVKNPPSGDGPAVTASAPAPAPFRLKPKLTPDPIPAAAAAPSAPALVSSPAPNLTNAIPPPATKPHSAPAAPDLAATKSLVSEIPASVTANEANALKLKPKVAAPVLKEATSGVNLVSWPTPPVVPASTPANSLSPIPITLAPPASLTPFVKPSQVPVPSGLKVDDPAADKNQRRVLKVGAITLVAVTIVVGVGGFFAWKQFTKPNSSTTQTPAVTTKQSTAATPAGDNGDNQSKTPPAPSAQPAALSQESAKNDAGSAAVGSPIILERTANVSSPEGTTATPPVAPSPVDIPVPISASPEFRAFVATVKISGVFQGENGRAFINGRLTRFGDPVDSRLGILFAGIDADKKLLVFKDASGATTTRKY
ncbi:MAG: hypothetical protein ABIO94_00730, partial [Opitutaceae bacterium]